MRVLIVEDEKPAAEKLTRFLKEYDPQLDIIGHTDSVRKTVEALQSGLQPELMFMDIQLTDGLSFTVFEQVEAPCPIIFTTAFNEYAMQAFQTTGVDYLLKPLTYEAVAGSLEKLKRLRETLTTPTPSLESLAKALHGYRERTYKARFMVKVGEHIRSVTAEQIRCFYAEGRTCYLVTDKGRFIVDYKLEDLEDLLDPRQFMRVNRSFIIQINAIKDVLVYSNSRLKLSLTIEVDREIIVSRDKVAPFKEWFDGAV